jgi:hypothetical protein
MIPRARRLDRRTFLKGAALANALAGRKEKEAADAVRAALPDLHPTARELLGGAFKDREGAAPPAAQRQPESPPRVFFPGEEPILASSLLPP